MDEITINITDNPIIVTVIVTESTTSDGGDAATQAEVNAGTVDNKFVSPETLKNWNGNRDYPSLITTQVTTSALSESLQGVAMVTMPLSNGASLVFFLGGFTSGTDMRSTVYVAHTADLSNIVQLDDAPWEGRNHFGHCAIDNFIVIWGASLSDWEATNSYSGEVDISTVDPDNLAALSIIWVRTGGMPMPGTLAGGSGGVGGPPCIQGTGAVLDNIRCLYGHPYDDQGRIYLIGGQVDDASPQYCYGDVWRSADKGANWTLIATRDDLFKQKVLSGACGFLDGVLYVKLSGTHHSGLSCTVVDPSLFVVTYTEEIVCSRDYGVTWEVLSSTLHKGTQFGECVVANGNLYWLFGERFVAAPHSGTPTDLIQYIDNTGAVHIAYTDVPKRVGPGATTVTIDGVDKILTGLGIDPTGPGLLNDLYLLEPGPDQKVVNGDITQLTSLTVDDEIQTNEINPLETTDPVSINEFLHVLDDGSGNKSLGVGTDTPQRKVDLQVVNIVLSADQGAGGGNHYETDTRTSGVDKVTLINMVTRDNSLIGAFCLFNNRIYLGGTDGFGQTIGQVNLPIKTVDAAPANGDFWNDGTHVYFRIGGAWKQLD